MKTVNVGLGSRGYDIRIGIGLLHERSAFEEVLPGKHVLVLSDEHVAPLYLQRVQTTLAHKQVSTLVLPAGEEHKTLASFSRVMETLAATGATRDAGIVALGGGVIGDLAGFAAACWMRGIRFVQCPTTLLAMVDSSVGGKTAVDLPQGKNLVGAFHQPVRVLADTSVLASLPAREWRAGLAEVVKYGAIVDPGFFAWLEGHADALLEGEQESVQEMIARSCQHKADIVARDETEQGERMLLNFGHTFGHAIETLQGYGGLRHGEAVAVGMVLAAQLSERLGLAHSHDTQRLQALLERLQLPTRKPAELGAEAMLASMRLDKKALSSGLRLILWHGIGRAAVLENVPESALLALLGT